MQELALLKILINEGSIFVGNIPILSLMNSKMTNCESIFALIIIFQCTHDQFLQKTIDMVSQAHGNILALNFGSSLITYCIKALKEIELHFAMLLKLLIAGQIIGFIIQAVLKSGKKQKHYQMLVINKIKVRRKRQDLSCICIITKIWSGKAAYIPLMHQKTRNFKAVH